jgi:hypothetical protein
LEDVLKILLLLAYFGIGVLLEFFLLYLLHYSLLFLNFLKIFLVVFGDTRLECIEFYLSELFLLLDSELQNVFDVILSKLVRVLCI